MAELLNGRGLARLLAQVEERERLQRAHSRGEVSEEELAARRLKHLTEQAHTWATTANPALGGRTPRQLLEAGETKSILQIFEELER